MSVNEQALIQLVADLYRIATGDVNKDQTDKEKLQSIITIIDLRSGR